MAVAPDFLNKAYLAYFGRPADYPGYNYYLTRTEADVVNSFSNSAESLRLYGYNSGASFDPSSLVDAIYQNLFNRVADAKGKSYWVEQIQGGFVPAAQAALYILGGASGIDRQTVTAKLNAASAFYDGLNTVARQSGYGGDQAAQSARDWLSTFTFSSSIPTQAQVDQAVNHAIGAVQTDASYALTTSTDIIRGSSGNNTVLASINTTQPDKSTLNVQDVINGNGGTDTLSVTVVGDNLGGNNSLPAASYLSIEAIKVQNLMSSGAYVVDASLIAGLTSVVSDRSTAALSIINLATGASFGMIGNSTAGVIASYSNPTDAVRINLSGGTQNTNNATTISVTGSASKATINSMGAANTVGAIQLANNATVSTLEINSSSDFTASGISGFANNATVAVSGSAGNVNIGTLDAKITVFDAAGLSVGGMTVTLNNGLTWFRGGAGDDVVTAAARTAVDAHIDAGGGSANLLIVDSAANRNDIAFFGAAYTGFQQVRSISSNPLGGIATTLNVSQLVGTQSLETAARGAGFSGMTASEAATVLVSVSQEATPVTYALANDLGTKDVLRLNFTNASATVVENATALTVNGFEGLVLNVGSGGRGVFKADGLRPAVAGTDFDQFKLAAANSLKYVSISGDYAAQLDLTANAIGVTSVDASANTAGADIRLGGQSAGVAVVGSTGNDLISLGMGVTVPWLGIGNPTAVALADTVKAGAGNDTITSTQAVLALATIDGGAGTDTLIDTDAGTLIFNDATLKGVSNVEKLLFSSATALSMTAGANINSMASANGGVLDVSATSLTDDVASSINLSGLSSGKALTFNGVLANGATGGSLLTITGSSGADVITLSGSFGKAGGSGIKIDESTGGSAEKLIDVSGVTAVGATGGMTILGGAGNDTIKVGATKASITGNGGADKILLTANDGMTQIINVAVAGNSSMTSFDTVTNFQAAASGAADQLHFASQTLLTALGGANSGWTVVNGIATKTDATVTDFLSAIQANLVSGVAAFNDGTNMWVAYADGVGTATADQVVELIGLTGVVAVATAAAVNTIQLV